MLKTLKRSDHWTAAPRLVILTVLLIWLTIQAFGTWARQPQTYFSSGANGRMLQMTHGLQALTPAEECSRLAYDLSLAQSEGLVNASCLSRCRAQQELEGCFTECTAKETALHLQNKAAAEALEQRDYHDFTFVVFFATGTRLAEKYPTHQFVRPNMHFVPVLRKSHPGCKIVMLTDMETQFDIDPDIEIFRFPLDRTKMGRNAYANLYQYMGQVVYLQHLIDTGLGSAAHITFMDMDVLILEPIPEVFCQDYGYGLTINADDFDPIDIGVQFVKKGFYKLAIDFLNDIIRGYKIDNPVFFTIGQVATRDALELVDRDTRIYEIAAAATRSNSHCRTVKGVNTICFFPCQRYNYWEECMHGPRLALPQDPAAYRRHGVKILQFVAYRKPGMDPVYEAYMREGTEGAYRAFAALPHDEAGYNRTFNAFNSDVTRICFPLDPDCPKNAVFKGMTAAQQAAAAAEAKAAAAAAAAKAAAAGLAQLPAGSGAAGGGAASGGGLQVPGDLSAALAASAGTAGAAAVAGEGAAGSQGAASGFQAIQRRQLMLGS